jgi:hypothetical protein
MVHFDPRGGCVYTSKSFIRAFVGESDWPLGTRGRDPFASALHPEERDILQDTLDACRQSPGDLVVSSLRLTDSQGNCCLTEWKMSLLPPATTGGSPLIYAVGVDKVDHFLDAQPLGVLQSLGKLLFDATPSPHICLGDAGELRFFNREAIQWIKARTGTLPVIGGNLHDTLRAGFGGQLCRKIDLGLAGRNACSDLRWAYPDGREEWYRVEVLPFHYGPEACVSISLVDITAQKRSADIMDSSRYLLSNQLRTHVSNVMGMSTMMEHLLATDNGASLSALVTMIKEEAGQLNRAVGRVEEALFSGGG